MCVIDIHPYKAFLCMDVNVKSTIIIQIGSFLAMQLSGIPNFLWRLSDFYEINLN